MDHEDKPIFLNLGCGNKLYISEEENYWINVDIVPPPSGVTFDYLSPVDPEESLIRAASKKIPLFEQAELTQLKHFADNSVDEIHAYHVIEHFYKNDVPKVLTEWKRVLKPGGRLYLEQPDIVKCAANFLAGLHNGDQLSYYNLGILGMYGESNSNTPYMGHHWGWTFMTLSKEFHKVGFIEIQEQFAQTHAKVIRDFRIKGVKPYESISTR